MEKPRCQGCLGDLQVERPQGGEAYVWCLRCGARDDREPHLVIALLEQPEHGSYGPRESMGQGMRHSPRQERGDHRRMEGLTPRARQGRSTDTA
jgi:hypothetical protein